MKRKELKDPMKLKNKILLAASGLLVLSGAAATTGTFAWFTVTNEATMTSADFKAQSDTNELKITSVTSNAKDETPAETSSDTDHQVWEANIATTLTDISGNGTNFFKANINNDGSEVYSAVKKDVKLPYVYQLTISFASSNSKNMGVFFNLSTSKIEAVKKEGKTPADDADKLKDSFRVAFLDGEDGETLKGFWAPSEDFATTDINYISDATTDGKTTGVTSSKTLTPSWDSKVDKTVYNDASSGVDTNKTGYLTTVNGSNAKAITVRAWFEGQDPDCTEQIRKTFEDNYTLSVNMNFYGVSNMKFTA